MYKRQLQGGLHGLGGALDVGLDDDVQVLDLALLDLAEQIVQADLLLHAAGSSHLLVVLALLHQLTGHALSLIHISFMAVWISSMQS